MKFRKKPVVIDALQYTGFNIAELREWSPAVTWSDIHGAWAVRTLEGDMKISRNDWVIKGVQCEFYPCKADIFEATYEEA